MAVDVAVDVAAYRYSTKAQTPEEIQARMPVVQRWLPATVTSVANGKISINGKISKNSAALDRLRKRQRVCASEQ